MVDGDHFHVMTIRLPGIGLRKVGRPARRPKPLVLIPSYGIDTCITLNLVLYEGEWRNFVKPLPGQKAIGVITNQYGRTLSIFLRKEKENSPAEFYNKFLNTISTTIIGKDLPDNITVFSTHQRQAHEPILITELHNITVNKGP